MDEKRRRNRMMLLFSSSSPSSSSSFSTNVWIGKNRLEKERERTAVLFPLACHLSTARNSFRFELNKSPAFDYWNESSSSSSNNEEKENNIERSFFCLLFI